MQPTPVYQTGSVNYNDSCLQGAVFSISNAIAGVALTANAATTQNFGIINPLGSNKVLIPICFKAVFRGTTGTEGAFVYNYQTGANFPAATGGAITTFTDASANIINRALGSPSALRPVAKVAVASGSIVFASAPTFIENAGIGYNIITDATATNQPYNVREDFTDDLSIWPGTIFIVCGSASDATLWNMTLVWKEKNLPLS